jgi:hypothetical protein
MPVIKCINAGHKMLLFYSCQKKLILLQHVTKFFIVEIDNAVIMHFQPGLIFWRKEPTLAGEPRNIGRNLKIALSVIGG